MKTTYTDIKVHTKVSKTEYDKLESVCNDYGLSSAYQILQTLIRVLVRFVDPSRDAEQPEGVPVELTEIVREALEDFKANKEK